MTDSIFKEIFGTSWDALPPVMKKHYANRGFSNDVTHVEGQLDVSCRHPLKAFGPLMALLQQIPLRNEAAVPTRVTFRSDPNSNAFHFERQFHFSGEKPYGFHSRMLPLGGSEVVEIMRFGIGWKLEYLWDGEKVVLEHRGYVLQLFGRLIPVPLTFLMGAGYAEEHAIDDETFEMVTHITHPLWGRVYQYAGRFRIV